jgi:beta-galactosidase
MERRRFVQIGALGVIAPLTAMALSQNAEARNAGAAAQTPSASGHSFGFAPDGSAFLLDGKPFQIRSGEIHPSRIPVPYWRQRIRMAKAMGLNTVSLYVMWNYHEYREGHFDFRTGNRDIAGFIRLCQAEGMWVLLRPGPYVCGEWDLGGIPAWLLRYPDIRLRTDSGQDPHYMAAARRYIAALAAEVRPLFAANGGPVLMLQVENEYGSYGNDAAYVAEVRQAWEDNGITGPFYTEDGLGQLEANHTETPGGAIGLSGGDAASIAQARKAFPTVPAMAGELYPGWLTHWGDDGFQGADSDVTGDLRALMDGGLSFNLYMAHGGTSFGWMNGANSNGKNYEPDVTSYDYDAPLDESGRPTPKYFLFRDTIAKATGKTPPPVPAVAPPIEVPSFTLTQSASLWDNLPTPIHSEQPLTMEDIGQAYGYILYRTTLNGPVTGDLVLDQLHDYAQIYVDGKLAGTLDRRLDQNLLPLNITTNNARLDILVENTGRVNFTKVMRGERKGITKQVTIAGRPVTGWDIYPLPMTNTHTLHYSSAPCAGACFYRATFNVEKPADTFLDTSAVTKGEVWLNGHALGRVWNIGPQKTLYVPGPWLKQDENEVIVFDLNGAPGRSLQGLRKPVLDAPVH